MVTNGELKTIALWIDQAPMPEGISEATPPESVDVAIVGGGYTGLVAAMRLAEAGAAVVVLERHELGWGGSSRNGGKALVGLKKPGPVLCKRFGDQNGRDLWQASVDGISLIEQLVRDENIDCDFERCGSLMAACKPAHFAKMQEETQWLKKEMGYERIDVGPSEMRTEIGSDAYCGGVVDPLSAGIDPAKFTIGLAVAGKKRGVSFVENCNVEQLDREGSAKFAVGTSRGRIEAQNVLIATNGYTGNLVKQLQRRVIPVGSYIITTEPLSDELQRDISPKGRMFYDSKWFLNYFRITPDGRLFFGGRTTISPDQDLLVSSKILNRAMCEVFPQAKGARVTHSWGGNLGVTFDALPHMGDIDGVHFALGYCGHGVAMSTYLGQQVADVIAGKEVDSLFQTLQAPTHFFYRNRPWFRPILGAGLRVMDALT
jgi:glycine/D-amino acid oxidase-like deaminating enzyme